MIEGSCTGLGALELGGIASVLDLQIDNVLQLMELYLLGDGLLNVRPSCLAVELV
ncbi:hypothetical protein D3C75_1199450 [compost metagenome]